MDLSHPEYVILGENRARILQRLAVLAEPASGRRIHELSGARALRTTQRILDELVALGGSTFDVATYNRFQKNLANGHPNEWHCAAGCRYLYVCEDGLVHWCSQQRGHPGIPLEQYGPADLQREYHAAKSCAPFCTVGCVHRVAQVDELRHDPQAVLAQWFPTAADARTTEPVGVRILRWAFVTNAHRNLFRDAATRLFGAGR